jgi:Fur family peroxide stress response transcriptional regulator
MPAPQKRQAELTSKLKARGYRLTPQRLAIIRILAASTSHPSVEQVYDRVRADFPTTSLATVYKTVTLLRGMGEVLELSFGADGNRYDGNKPYPHPHLICLKCRRILDPEVNGLSEWLRQVGRMTGYRVTGHRLDLYGLCPGCQKREPGKRRKYHE